MVHSKKKWFHIEPKRVLGLVPYAEPSMVLSKNPLHDGSNKNPTKWFSKEP